MGVADICMVLKELYRGVYGNWDGWLTKCIGIGGDDGRDSGRA